MNVWQIIAQSQSGKPVSKTECNLVFNVCIKGVSTKLDALKESGLYNKFVNHFVVKQQLLTYVKKIYNHKVFPKKNMIVFPRFGMIKFLEENYVNYTLKNLIPKGIDPSVPFRWTGSFKGNQQIVVNYIMENIFNKKSNKRGNSGLILNLEAGQGKSYIGMGLIEKLKKNTLIVTHNCTIMNQWVKILKEAYPHNTIGKYYGLKKEFGDIVVGVINSLVTRCVINGQEVSSFKFFSHFGFMIIDEAHEYSSNMRKKIYNKAQTQYVLGLSATPDERPGMDDINTWGCGEILDAKELVGYSVKDIPFTGEVNMIKYLGHPNYTQVVINEKTGLLCFTSTIRQICEDPYRIKIIIREINKLRNDDKFVFVFADRRKYLEKIAVEFTNYQMMTNDKEHDKVIALMGGSTDSEMIYAKEKCAVILTTYQYMGTGCSIPKMNSIVLTTPRKKKSKQYINRIFRLGSNYNIKRKIIDVVDWHTCAKSQWYIRKKYYLSKKYPIIETTISYSDIDLSKFNSNDSSE